jgi:hypothetical protein
MPPSVPQPLVLKPSPCGISSEPDSPPSCGGCPAPGAECSAALRLVPGGTFPRRSHQNAVCFSYLLEVHDPELDIDNILQMRLADLSAAPETASSGQPSSTCICPCSSRMTMMRLIRLP